MPLLGPHVSKAGLSPGKTKGGKERKKKNFGRSCTPKLKEEEKKNKGISCMECALSLTWSMLL